MGKDEATLAATDATRIEVLGALQGYGDREQSALKSLHFALAGKLLELTDEAIFYTDEGLELQEANPAFHRLFCISPDAVKGMALCNLLNDTGNSFTGGLMAELAKSGTWKGEIRRRTDKGESRPETLLLSAVHDEATGKLAYLGIIRDFSELSSAKAILEYSTSHDSLTGLPNREYFHDALSDLIRISGENKGVIAVCVLDLDDFKRINNDLSRDAGDELLRAVGRRLSETLRTGDLLARSGGDEFSLAFPLKFVAELRSLAARILGLFDAPFETAGRLLYVNATMGISICPEHGLDAAKLSACADLALQSRKIGAKSSYAVYREDLGARLHGKASLASELRAALDAHNNQGGAGGNFFVRYQPLVEISSGLVVSTEALARWDHPERGSISPVQFIPLAEESGLIVELGSLVLRIACSQLRSWLSLLSRPPRVCVNVSARQLQESAFVEEVRRTVSGLPRGLITLEITESQLFEDLDGAATTLVRLKETGVQLSVDDFGTGYASLSYLKKLPIDTVKIDQSFVKDLVRNRQDRRIVEAVATLARELGARTVAEGVETKAQLELLREIGCDYAQGFLFSPAVAPEGISNLVSGGFDGAGAFISANGKTHETGAGAGQANWRGPRRR